MTKEQFYAEIERERERQELTRIKNNWPRIHQPERWLTILVEEVGEVAKCLLEPEGDLVKELVQIAAVCEAWVTQYQED